MYILETLAFMCIQSIFPPMSSGGNQLGVTNIDNYESLFY